MKLGFSTWGKPNLPIEVIIKHLANLGFDGVEIAVLPRFSTALVKLNQAERQRIPRLLQAHGLSLSARLIFFEHVRARARGPCP